MKMDLKFWLDVYDKLDDELYSVNEEVNWIHEYIGRPFLEDTKKELRELDDLYNKYYHMREYVRGRILNYNRR